MRSIDADALKNAFSNMYREDYERWIKEVIDNAPTIEPFEKIGAICIENCGGYRPKGEWKYTGMGIYECTNCKAEYEAGISDHCNVNNSEYRFCPNCGADMRGEV